MLSAVKYLCSSCEAMVSDRVEIAREYCLHTRHCASVCNACGEVCPHKAIEEGVLDGKLCTGCGLCLAACPAGAIGTVAGGHIKRYHQVKTQGRNMGSCAFVCRRGADLYKGGIMVECLMSCDESLLLTAAAYGAKQILLLAEACGNCPQGETCFDVLSDRVAKVYGILQQFGIGCEFVFSRDKFSCQENVSVQKSGISRRQFFRSLKAGSLNMLGHVVADIRDAWEVENKDKNVRERVKYLPYRWYVLRQIFKGWRGRSRAGRLDYFGTVKVNESCHGCGACADACPTGALQFMEKDGRRIISHRPALCTDCGLCQEICMKEALTVTMGVDYDTVVQEQELELMNCSNEAVEKTLDSMENRLAALLGCEVKKN